MTRDHGPVELDMEDLSLQGGVDPFRRKPGPSFGDGHEIGDKVVVGLPGKHPVDSGKKVFLGPGPVQMEGKPVDVHHAHQTSQFPDQIRMGPKVGLEVFCPQGFDLVHAPFDFRVILLQGDGGILEPLAPLLFALPEEFYLSNQVFHCLLSITHGLRQNRAQGMKWPHSVPFAPVLQTRFVGNDTSHPSAGVLLPVFHTNYHFLHHMSSFFTLSFPAETGLRFPAIAEIRGAAVVGGRRNGAQAIQDPEW